MQTSTKRTLRPNFNLFIGAAMAAVMGRNDKVNEIARDWTTWTPPKFTHGNAQHPPQREQGKREVARRVRQLEAGIIHTN